MSHTHFSLNKRYVALVVGMCLFSMQKLEGYISNIYLNTKLVGVMAEVIERHFPKKTLEDSTFKHKSACICGEPIERLFPRASHRHV